MAAQTLYSPEIPSNSGYSGPIVVNPVTGKVYLTYTSYSDIPDEPGGPFVTGAGVVVIDPSAKTSAVIDDNAYESVFIAVNPVTNKVYVSPAPGGLMEIDGVTNATSSIATDIGGPIAVNPVTNKIYVASESSDVVAVVDGLTHAIAEVATGPQPGALAINPTTNKIYVANSGGSSVTEIDGTSNVAATIATGGYPGSIAIDPVTNKVYVSQEFGVTVIDGTTDATTTVADLSSLGAPAVNPMTNKVYFPRNDAVNLSVFDGATDAVSMIGTGTIYGIAVNPVTDTIFAAANSGVIAINGTTNAVTPVAPYAAGPIAVNPVTNTVFFLTASGVEGIEQGIPASLSFTTQPIAQTIGAGAPFALDALVGAGSNATYHWFDNGTPLSDGPGVSGSSTSTLYLSSGVTSANTGTYHCVATSDAGSASSVEVPVTVTTTSSPGRLVNLSSRAFAGTGSQTMISGFVIGGSGSKSVILRGDGPALSSFDVTGALATPMLSLFDSANPANLITHDSGWQNQPTVPAGYWAGSVTPADATSSDFSQVGAFPLSEGSADSAISIALPAGGYTCQISGANAGTGTALSEIYDADTGSPSTTLTNISTRAFAGTGAESLIAGFVISGSTSQTVLIRAAGPALGAFGLSGTLPDPQLQVFDSSQNLVASNIGWSGSPEIAEASAAAGAFAWNNPSSDDSAVLITLPPGKYTAQASGQAGDTGLALIEIYAVPPVGP